MTLSLALSSELPEDLIKVIKTIWKFEPIFQWEAITTKINRNFVITSQEFAEFKNLTHLTLSSSNVITDKFFESIDEYLPKLQSIEFEKYRYNWKRHSIYYSNWKYLRKNQIQIKIWCENLIQYSVYSAVLLKKHFHSKSLNTFWRIKLFLYFFIVLNDFSI